MEWLFIFAAIWTLSEHTCAGTDVAYAPRSRSNMSNSHLALFVSIHPASNESRNRILDLLSEARPYYLTPESKCTTWAYFTPSVRPKAPSQLIADPETSNVLAAVEIYTEKSALSTQLQASAYKEFCAKVKDEKLYGKDEELVAYRLAGGFVARNETAKPFGKGVIVCTAKFTCKDGQKQKMVENLNKYTQWVKENEPGVLTYSIMVQPKNAPNEVLLYERYADLKSFAAHGSTKEFKAMFKSIAPHIEIKQTKLQEWSELDNAFVGNVIGGIESSLTSKL